ncbi:MAG: hypothetical protein BGO11_17310 [Solirubrobacterales bacterium 70-9]|nr:MAG: hypothetical protein BGO11_17310 [Solirubrobacterales bacterium 70-9]
MKWIGVVAAVLAVVAGGGTQALARAQATSSVSATVKSEPSVERGVLLWTIKGKVGSPNAACKAERTVKIEFIYERPPFVKSQTKTAKNGAISATVRLNGSETAEQPQELKLTVPKASAGGVTCKEATKTLALG